MSDRGSAQQIVNIAMEIKPIKPQSKVLDFGCGAGEMLSKLRAKGLHAYGCDFIDEFGVSDFTREVQATFPRGVTLAIEKPYRLPFPNNTFDYIFSAQVFEHVMDYDTTLKEIYRILKPGGLSINLFPGRYVPIEPHVCVPFATIIRNRSWLYFCALLGIRNQQQKGKSAVEVTQLNYDYLHNHTNYPTRTQLLSYTNAFSDAAFREEIHLRIDDSFKAKFARVLWKVNPYIPTLISDFYSRTLVLRK